MVIEPGMRVLLDTNILLRVTPEDPDDARQRIAAQSALLRITDLGARPCIATQTLAEYWNTATKPKADKGLAIHVEDVRERLLKFSRTYELVLEQSKTFNLWLLLCAKYQVVGKSVHDARLVATALSQNINTIMTYNIRHFRRFSEISTFAPTDILK